MTIDRYKFLVTAALADRKLDEREKAVLLKAAQHYGLTREQAGGIVRELAQGKSMRAELPADPQARAKLFESMVEMAAADGNVDPHEVALLQRLAPGFGLSEAQTADILKAVRDILDRGATRKLDRPDMPG